MDKEKTGGKLQKPHRLSVAHKSRNNSDYYNQKETSKPNTSTLKPATSQKPLTISSHSNTLRSTLTFIVPTLALCSVIPAVVAWNHGDLAIGTTHDSDFWQTVSSSILQLLSLITFIWPTLKDPGLSQLTWVWIWMLAGFSAICAIISVPVYLVEPTILSFVISFAGNLAQAVVQLQVVNAI
jgi:hypothetical protein